MSSVVLRLIAGGILIATILFYVFRFCPEIIEFFKDKIIQNIKILFAPDLLDVGALCGCPLSKGATFV